MEIGRHNWILRCVVICLALLCWYGVDGSVFESSCEDDSAVEILGHSSALNEAVSDIISSSELACQSCFSASARTLAKAHRQNSTKHSKYGFALIKSGKLLCECVAQACLNTVVGFPSGWKEANPLFIRLRKLIL